MPTLVDPDTPADARKRTGFDGKAYNLVFSDEFNVDGRTFVSSLRFLLELPLISCLLSGVSDGSHSRSRRG